MIPAQTSVGEARPEGPPPEGGPRSAARQRASWLRVRVREITMADQVDTHDAEEDERNQSILI